MSIFELEQLADARYDASREDDDEADMECGECGERWWGDWMPATRVDPAEPRRPDCPRCGS